MLNEYIQVAMHRAKYKLIGDETIFGEIPGCDGLWANAKTLEACQAELEESLEEWILLGLQLGHPIPIIDGIDLSFKKEAA